jgi:CDP-diacylglycerol---serine O-phosphatidyltransferase
MIRSYIPNSITSLNLLSGCLGIAFAMKGELAFAAWCIWAAALLDFMDGFLARILKAYSEIGKQLDSLADLISFGLLPASILYQMIGSTSTSEILPLFAFLLVLFSAWRLAKFNIDESQTNSFKGLPTPASAIFVSGLIYIKMVNIEDPYILLTIVLLLSFSMVSNLPLMALKFKNYGWKGNEFRYLLVLFSLLLLIFFGIQAISFSILLYILFSFISHFKTSNTEDKSI